LNVILFARFLGSAALVTLSKSVYFAAQGTLDKNGYCISVYDGIIACLNIYLLSVALEKNLSSRLILFCFFVRYQSDVGLNKLLSANEINTCL
jgi:hypothetical protein